MISIFSKEQINKTVYSQLINLFNTCSNFDMINYFLPSYEEMSEYSFFIFATKEDKIIGVLWNCDEALNEAFGMVLPEYRMKGVFRDMLSYFSIETYENLTFYGKPEYSLMKKCANALGFAAKNTELLMCYQGNSEPTEWQGEVFEDENSFSYYIDNKFIGSCSIFETDSTINIYEVYVENTCRNLGYGAQIISDVLWSVLNSEKDIILQVNKENYSAVRCYEKCGFTIKDATIFYQK